MSGPVKSGTVSASGDVILGEGAGGRVSSWLVQLVADGSWSGSVQPKACAVGSRLAPANVAYKNMGTGENATAALTTTALVLIDGAGVEVALTFTRNAGSIQWYAVPLVG